MYTPWGQRESSLLDDLPLRMEVDKKFSWVSQKVAVWFSYLLFFFLYLPVCHFMSLAVICFALIFIWFCVLTLIFCLFLLIPSLPCLVKSPCLSDKWKWRVILPWFKQCNHWSLGSSLWSTFALRLAWIANLLLTETMWPQQLNMYLTRDLERFEIIWWSSGFVAINRVDQNLWETEHFVHRKADLCW